MKVSQNIYSTAEIHWTRSSAKQHPLGQMPVMQPQEDKRSSQWLSEMWACSVPMTSLVDVRERPENRKPGSKLPQAGSEARNLGSDPDKRLC